jgi:hypothetical protein
MHLLIGDTQDLVCKSVCLALESAGYRACMVANPMQDPSRFVWRLDTANSSSRVTFENGTVLSGSQISAVLVRRASFLPTGSGDPDDLAYIQEEADAALLAWLWSLDCVVVNRYPPAIWYRRDQPLLLWRHLLERCGLRALDSIVSNSSANAAAYQTAPGSQLILVPLTSEGCAFLNADACSDADRVLVNRVPGHFMQPAIDVKRLCVVGPKIVWDGSPYANRDAIEPALGCLGELAGLIFFQMALTRVKDETRVAAVNPYPRLEDFTSNARSEIVAALVSLLTSNLSPNSRKVVPTCKEEHI